MTAELEETRKALRASIVERQRYEAALREGESFLAIEKMSATIAHEVRNPLGGIAGFAALLERDLDVRDPRRRLVKRIIEGVSTLNDIVANLLSYTRPIQLNLRAVDLMSLVDEAVSLFVSRSEQQENEITVDRRYGVRPLVCSIDAEQFQHVILNLLDNAIQAMAQGGELCVEIEADESDTAVIRISDSGSGIPDPMKAQLFVPFATTRENGTGLGLVIARRVIEAHGGTITVESEPGLGSLFTIRIPIHHL